jgi:predicted RND superfamily exporter protein
LVLIAVLAIFATQAFAYVGPAAVGGIGALIGIVVAILLSVVVIVALPIKILYRKLKMKKQSDK